MIAYLPELYPDELAYSWFCRYYAHSGYLTHKSALEDILYKRHNNPSKEFLGRLSLDMTEAIKRKHTIEDIILKHTMVPQYARFIPLDQKKNAVFHIGYDFCDAHHLFAILPRHETDAFLKYCPICADEDRQKYGETYWHRLHQLRNVQMCAKHGCLLQNSTVSAKSEGDFTLCPAETNIETEDPVMERNRDRYDFTKYICDVFDSPVDFEKDTPISAVLYNAMKKSRYMKSSGKSRYTKQLADDMQMFYQNIGLPDIASIYQIQRVLLGDRYDFSVVCQIAYYLGMSISELTAPTLTEKEVSEEQDSHYIKNREIIDWSLYDAETAHKENNTTFNLSLMPRNDNSRKGIYERVFKDIFSIVSAFDGYGYRVGFFYLRKQQYTQLYYCQSHEELSKLFRYLGRNKWSIRKSALGEISTDGFFLVKGKLFQRLIPTHDELYLQKALLRIDIKMFTKYRCNDTDLVL